jgi:hypothetical protein
MELGKEEREGAGAGGHQAVMIWRRGGDLLNISIYRLIRNAKEFFY